MLDTCLIQRVTGTTTDPDTGEVVPTYVTVYEGRCKLQTQGSYASTPAAGEYQWTATPLQLHLPVDGTADVGPDLRVEITASVDAANVGRTFRIRSDDRKTLQTALRCLIEEVQ